VFSIVLTAARIGLCVRDLKEGYTCLSPGCCCCLVLLMLLSLMYLLLCCCPWVQGGWGGGGSDSGSVASSRLTSLTSATRSSAAPHLAPGMAHILELRGGLAKQAAVWREGAGEGWGVGAAGAGCTRGVAGGGCQALPSGGVAGGMSLAWRTHKRCGGGRSLFVPVPVGCCCMVLPLLTSHHLSCTAHAAPQPSLCLTPTPTTHTALQGYLLRLVANKVWWEGG
jgi:hypothetical protein